MHGVRYGELERLMLGLIFAHAVYDYSDWGKGFIETCSDSPIKEEFVMVIQSMLPAKMSGKTESGENHIQSNTSKSNHMHPLFDIEGHFILSDITKSQAVINRLKMHDSSMQDASDSLQLDHDLAYQHLMSLDNEIIREIIGVNIPDRILEYSKLVSCPLHLGHASQAECHWSKIYECQLALADVSDKENLLNRAFLVQYLDIAGARAHKTGKIFLKDSIFASYCQLHHYLTALFGSDKSNENATKESYLQYLRSPIDTILQQQSADELNTLVSNLQQNPSCFEYFVMLAWQFRLLEEDNRIDRLCKLAKVCHEAFDTTTINSDFWSVDPISNSMKTILSEMQLSETPTYVPSIYQTLRSIVWPEITKEDSPVRQVYLDKFDNEIAFTLRVGLKLIAKGIDFHREHASPRDPCCFNDINRQLQQNPSAINDFLERIESNQNSALYMNESKQLLLTPSTGDLEHRLAAK